jgi:hypothetical protein
VVLSTPFPVIPANNPIGWQDEVYAPCNPMCDSPKADDTAVAIENASRTRLSVNDSKISILGNFQSSMRHPVKPVCFLRLICPSQTRPVVHRLAHSRKAAFQGVRQPEDGRRAAEGEVLSEKGGQVMWIWHAPCLDDMEAAGSGLSAGLLLTACMGGMALTVFHMRSFPVSGHKRRTLKGGSHDSLYACLGVW